MKRCPACYHKNPTEALFCENCDYKFTAFQAETDFKNESRHCPNCGHLNHSYAYFCEQCGQQLE